MIDRFEESNREPPGDVGLRLIGKRPFDHEDNYQSHRERPNKRARIEDGESSTNDLQKKRSAGQDKEIIKADEITEEKVVTSVDNGDYSKKIRIPHQILKQKSVSQHVKKFDPA